LTPSGADLISTTLQRVLAGDEQVVGQTTQALLRSGLDPVGVAITFLDPLLVETGRQWQTGHLSVTQEHVITALCTGALDVLAHEPAPGRRKAVSAVVGCAHGERHALGAKIVSLALRQRGWTVTDLGPSATAEEFLDAVRSSTARVVALSVATPQRVPATAALVAQLKDQEPGLYMIVGGRAADPALIPAADLVVGRDLDRALDALEGDEVD
jgi:methanogenic corrinoid protein MtbC1